MTLQIQLSNKEPARKLYVDNAGCNPKTGELENAKASKAAKKANAEFGIEQPDAFLLAYKEYNEEKLSDSEQIQLAGHRLFANSGLEPKQIRTAVYLYGLGKTASLNEDQFNLYNQYCTEATVANEFLNTRQLATSLHQPDASQQQG